MVQPDKRSRFYIRNVVFSTSQSGYEANSHFFSCLDFLHSTSTPRRTDLGSLAAERYYPLDCLSGNEDKPRSPADGGVASSLPCLDEHVKTIFIGHSDMDLLGSNHLVSRTLPPGRQHVPAKAC